MKNLARARILTVDSTTVAIVSRHNIARRAPSFAPRTRVIERNAQSARTGRIVTLSRNGLALVQWADGSTSHQTTYNLVRAGER